MTATARRVKIVIERNEDGYVAYPLGLKGVVVAEADSYAEVLQQVHSAIQFHLETFGAEAFEEASNVAEVFIAETEVPVG
jgi:predicted RNase H-like HicB family nuclease